MSMPWHEGRRLVSNEEYDLRWDILVGKKKMSKKEFDKKIERIRKKTGKP